MLPKTDKASFHSCQQRQRMWVHGIQPYPLVMPTAYPREASGLHQASTFDGIRHPLCVRAGLRLPRRAVEEVRRCCAANSKRLFPWDKGLCMGMAVYLVRAGTYLIL